MKKEEIKSLLVNVGDMALKRRARMILEEIDPAPGDNILDVGCGDGYYLHLISNLEKKSRLKGTDFDEKALVEARKNLFGRRISLFRADLMKKLPFGSGEFDKAVMSEVAEHLPNDVKGLKEVRRVLKKGGTLIVTVPNHNYPFFWDPVNWILEHFFGTHIKSGFWAGIWNQHKRLYKESEIKRSLEKAGFKIEKIRSTTWWCLPFNHYILNFGARMLYGGSLSPNMAKSVSKYSKASKRYFYINIFFGTVNLVDRLNNYFSPSGSGVGVFVKARK